MHTQFKVTVGKKAYGYGKETERSFEATVFRQGETVEVHFFFEGSRHHAGTIKTGPDVARWLAHALLAATEGARDSRLNSIQVKDDLIVLRTGSSTTPDA